MENTPPDKPLKRPRLRLPFDNRREDAGAWAYDHRIGLCITLIAYLVLAIVFVGSKITVGGRPVERSLYIDLNTLAELEEERDRLEAETRERSAAQEEFDWGRVQNRTSNENALNEDLKTDRGSHAAELNASAAEAASRMQANREAYERGLAEAEAIRRSGQEGSAADAERQESRVSGYVTVRLDVKNPVRRERHLVKPAYQCEGGGEVVVEIEVRPDGRITSARVLSGGDDYMREVAVRAARASTLDINPDAPEHQKGTITYIFIPQR